MFVTATMTPTRKSERLKGRWPATETTDATSFGPAKNVAVLKRKNAPEAKPDPKDAKKQRIEDPNLGKLERMDEVPLDVLYEVCSCNSSTSKLLTLTRSFLTYTLLTSSTFRAPPRCFEMLCTPSPVCMHGPMHLTTLDLTLAESLRTSISLNLPDFFSRSVVR